jgi:hypothetical protein
MESGFYRVFPLLPRVTFAMVLAKCRTARFVTPLTQTYFFSKSYPPELFPLINYQIKNFNCTGTAIQKEQSN